MILQRNSKPTTQSLAIVLRVAMVFAIDVNANCFHGNETMNLTLWSGMGMSTSDSGVLGIFLNGSWGTVCYQYFTNKAAAVACKSLGKHYYNAYRVHGYEFLKPEDELPESLVSSVRCDNVKAKCLDECVITYGARTKSCPDKSLIGLVCTQDPVPATWQYKGQWLPLDVKEINVKEGDEISCAAINDRSHYMSTKMFVPGEPNFLKSGVGKQTLTDVKRSQTGLLACNVSNGDYRNQNSSIIKLNVLFGNRLSNDSDLKPEETTPVYIYIISSLIAVVVVVVVVVVAVLVMRRRSKRHNVATALPIGPPQCRGLPRSPRTDRPSDGGRSSGSSTYFIAVDINVASGNTYDSIPG